jgi:hypothetical protein
MTRSERPAADEDDVADLVNQQAVDLDSSGAKKSGEVDRLSLRKSSRREENAEKQQDSSAEHRLTPIYAATVFVFMYSRRQSVQKETDPSARNLLR